MSELAERRRLRKYKEKTLNNLLNNYRIVLTAQKPFHFHCYDKNGHKFVMIETDDLSDITKERLKEIKKGLPDHSIIQIHFYEKYAKKPKLIDI